MWVLFRGLHGRNFVSLANSDDSLSVWYQVYYQEFVGLHRGIVYEARTSLWAS